jgi:hypothetical protein
VKAADGNVIDRALYPSTVAERDSELSESVTVSGGTPVGQASRAAAGRGAGDAKVNEAVREAQKQEPSQNVINLQKRAAGVLPVRVDVPRAGTSHQFVRPLVVDQETFVNLRYKRR